ncbi:MAG: ABC transporter ATP-binding protein [Frankiaceae bacterium]
MRSATNIDPAYAVPEVRRPLAPPVILARGLHKRYGDVRAVDGLDFEIEPGESVGFLGPNGAGKSTTMRMIGCTTAPSSGDLRVFGLPAAKEARSIRARLGVIPQDDTLDMELTVAENLYVYGCYFGLRRTVIRDRSARLLEAFQLSEKASSLVTTLSGGMRRRLTIARSLISEPELLLLDEPTNGLDPQARHALWDQLRLLQQQGKTLLLTTHFMDEAERLCDRLLVIDGGRIVAQGSPRALIAAHCGREVLELHFDRDTPAAQYLTAVEAIANRVDVLTDRLLAHVDNGDAALAVLSGNRIPFETALVRRASLEDVFLRLTGRALVD